MPQFQEMSSATIQLPGELSRGHTLGETTNDEDQHRGAKMGALERGPGPGVEDPSTRGAAIVEDRFSIVAVDEEPIPSLAAGTTQAFGMEQVEEEVVTGVLIHKGLDREVHGSVSSRTERHSLLRISQNSPQKSRVGQYHSDPMSHYFYLQDRDFGRMFVRVCPYFPFSARARLNGHEWLACRLRA